MFWAKRLLLVAIVTGACAAVPTGAAWAAPPSNDTFPGATAIGSAPFTDTLDTTEATLDAADTSARLACMDQEFTFSNSVWYAYTPTSDQVVLLDTSGSSYNVAGAVLTGTPGSFSAVFPAGCFNTRTAVSLTAGTTYYIELLQFGGGSGGTLQLSVSESVPPPNDTFSGAKAIGSVPFDDTEVTTQATADAADASAETACRLGGFSNSVWYAYTPASDQDLQIDTIGSSYTVAGAVLTGTPGSFSAVPRGCFLTGTVVHLTAGTTYYVDLGAFGSGPGGALHVSFSEGALPNPALTVNRSGRFSKSGAATVSGTASCAPGAIASQVQVSLTQSVGHRATISGVGSSSTSIVCDGVAHPWSAVVTSLSGKFKGGKAQGSTSFDACTFSCDDKQVTQTIILNGKKG